MFNDLAKASTVPRSSDSHRGGRHPQTHGSVDGGASALVAVAADASAAAGVASGVVCASAQPLPLPPAVRGACPCPAEKHSHGDSVNQNKYWLKKQGKYLLKKKTCRKNRALSLVKHCSYICIPSSVVGYRQRVISGWASRREICEGRQLV